MNSKAFTITADANVNVPYGMKPFNLADALAGKPVVTRDGRKVTYIHDTGENITKPVVFRVEGSDELSNATRIGTTYIDRCVSGRDLFMAKQMVTKYVNIFKSELYSDTLYVGSQLFDTEEAARTYGQKQTGIAYITTTTLTYEE